METGYTHKLYGRRILHIMSPVRWKGNKHIVHADSNYKVMASIFNLLENKDASPLSIVNSKVTPIDGGPEIKIDWRIYTKNPEKPLIRDLIVEGLSLARTQKEEFSSILSSNNNDINILISKLEEFVKN